MIKNKLFVKIIFGIVLAVLIVSFLNVGISLFYPEPKYNDYCDIYPRAITAETPDEEVEEINKEQKRCNDEFETVNNKYNRIVFFILAPIGFALLIIGTFITNLTIQIMLMGSGFINIVMAIMRNIQDKISIFVAIGMLIVIGIIF